MPSFTTEFNHRDFSLHVQGEPPPGYPRQSISDAYSLAANPTTGFAGRRAAFLDFCLRNPAPPNFKAPFYELPRLTAGQPIHEGVLQAACDFIDERRDCADFILHALLRLLYQFREAPLSAGLWTRLRQSVLNFKYWPDEPGVDSLCTWTENHQVLYASAAYLAGQLFPDETFTNSGRKGRELMETHAPRLQRWLDLRFRSGFSEWLSNVYYDEDLTALVSLLDFCQEAELRRKAGVVVNLLILDLALHHYQGMLACTHGRSYENHRKHGAQAAVADTLKLLFGAGIYARVDNMSAIALALSPVFQLHPVLEDIARDTQRPETEIRQRMGLRLAQAERWGLVFENFEDGMVYLSLEAYLHPRNVNLTLRMFDAFNWWNNLYFAPFKKNKSLINILRRLHLMPAIARLLERDACRNTREEVNLYTYRTPAYQLSSAVDYRKGYGGDQQAIWQASLAPDAVCFVTHPAKLTGNSPDYWTGEGTLPRVGQYKNVLVSLYQIDTRPGLYHTNRLLYTHAYLPAEQFDQVYRQDNWVFARKGEGYLAVWARNGFRPEPGSQPLNDELISDGKENIWLCELGRPATHGSFEQFIEQVSQAEIRCQGLNITYRSPSLGLVEFGWQQPLRVNQAVTPLSDFARYDCPYVQAKFDPTIITVQAGGRSLVLDWQPPNRISQPTPQQLQANSYET